MKAEFETHINAHFSFLKERNILVACSGGLDSMVLVKLFHLMEFSMGIAHCNFQLRGEASTLDAQFVEDWAKQHKIPFHCQTFETTLYAKTHKQTIQEAARNLRYDWFSKLLHTKGYDYLATAHHADDNQETFFINLIRGTGIKGLLGIPSISGQIVRPLLQFSKANLLAYAKQSGLFWREDTTNQQTHYLRNALRLKVLPELQTLDKRFNSNFIKTQQNLKTTQQLLEDYLQLVYTLVVTEAEETVKITLPALSGLPNKHALLYLLLKPFGFSESQNLNQLFEAQTGKIIKSNTHQALKNREHLIVTAIENTPICNQFMVEAPPFQLLEPLPLFIEYTTQEPVNSNNIIFVDAKTLQFPLQLRRWQEGDWFKPIGMQGSKKLSKFFKDEKLSLVAKSKVWLLCSNQQIVWVIGFRADARFKVTTQTTEVIRISTKAI